jgi:hypothetical protein
MRIRSIEDFETISGREMSLLGSIMEYPSLCKNAGS